MVKTRQILFTTSDDEFSYLSLLLSLSVIISSKNTLYFILALCSLIFLWKFYILFEYSIRAFGFFMFSRPLFSRFLIRYWYLDSFIYLTYTYCFFIRLSNSLDFSDLELAIINILHGWSVNCDQFGLRPYVFPYIDTFNFFVFVYYFLICFI